MRTVLNYLMFLFAVENQVKCCWGCRRQADANTIVRHLTALVVHWLSWLMRHCILLIPNFGVGGLLRVTCRILFIGQYENWTIWSNAWFTPALELAGPLTSGANGSLGLCTRECQRKALWTLVLTVSTIAFLVVWHYFIWVFVWIWRFPSRNYRVLHGIVSAHKPCLIENKT